jgi:hypothetical protein
MPLTGTELLTKIHSLGDAPRDQVAIACGYVNDKGKPGYTAFYEALILAKGVSLCPPSGKPAKGRGKQPSFKATVAKTGTVPIGAAYTSLIGAKPGDTITIGHEGSRLWLEVTAVADAPSEAAVSPVEAVEASPASMVAAGAPAAALAPF